MTTTEYDKRSKTIKDLILNLLFEDKKGIITEVTIKKEIDCYNVNIEKVVFDINQSKLFAPISCYKNGYGVLSLSV